MRARYRDVAGAFNIAFFNGLDTGGILMAQKYITGDASGWLSVKLASGTIASLPQFLTVNFLRTEGGRDYFSILEGPYSNQHASVQRNGSASWLANGDLRQPAANLVFKKSTKQFWYAGFGPIDATTSTSNPIATGTHDVEIPDYPHLLGSQYRSQSQYATTWFRVGHLGDRYLHAGSISAGCLTILDVPKWTSIYNFIIRRRKGDAKSVGSVWVQD